MKVVSPVLKRVVYPGLARSGFLRRAADNGPTIVTYHGVMPTSYKARGSDVDGCMVHSSIFRDQLKLLKSHYSPITPDQFRAWCRGDFELPPRAVLITCDDGLQNNLTGMAPILTALDLPCLFFVLADALNSVGTMLWHEELNLLLHFATNPISLTLPRFAIQERITGRAAKHALWVNLMNIMAGLAHEQREEIIDQVRNQLGVPSNWREDFFADPSNRERFLTLNLDQTKELLASGMTIGAHSLSHPRLSKMSDEMAWKEISESRRQLEDVLGQPIWAFAYPFGDPAAVSGRETAMAKQAGYDCAFMNVEPPHPVAESLFAISRVHVSCDMSVNEFEAHVSGFYRTLRDRFLGDSWTAHLAG